MTPLQGLGEALAALRRRRRGVVWSARAELVAPGRLAWAAPGSPPRAAGDPLDEAGTGEARAGRAWARRCPTDAPWPAPRPPAPRPRSTSRWCSRRSGPALGTETELGAVRARPARRRRRRRRAGAHRGRRRRRRAGGGALARGAHGARCRRRADRGRGARPAGRPRAR
ncbi:MAG: hypothetical protein U5K43_06115 [Halofilum sp. (in: g-proteobacteria)]|nr:hypothetical protein [Halofilum sp. (in: g-proteobacteria)]